VTHVEHEAAEPEQDGHQQYDEDDRLSTLGAELEAAAE
jgi:hypothetical protein